MKTTDECDRDGGGVPGLCGGGGVNSQGRGLESAASCLTGEARGAPSIAVIGLGYVGLPLAVALSRMFPTVGFDISAERVVELSHGRDRTGEVEAQKLFDSNLSVSADPECLKGRSVYIVAVPTPVDLENRPDLGPVLSACASVGRAMAAGAVVVFESTVFPGATEDVCGPELERWSGLVRGRDFKLGYSPERMNPGDKEHAVEKIVKVVSGEDGETTELLGRIYGSITSGGIFPAASIRVAEAAKVIENAQRDINIAFMNEISMIFGRLGISIHDVLDAASTKWNFLNFKPGLVGGHCIGVDPFYLARCALDNGHIPEVVLAGRRINDGMGAWIAARISEQLRPKSRILVLGLTFKENVPDLRNSKVIDIISGLVRRGHEVHTHDPMADVAEALHEYGVDLLPHIGEDAPTGYDAVVGAVAHDVYADFGLDDFSRLLGAGGLVADVKGMWRKRSLPEAARYWSL